MAGKQVLFAFGPARGGTTFVGSILGKWFDYGMGPEGTFVRDAWRVSQKIGDLSQPTNRGRYATYLSKVQMLEIIRKRYPHGERFDVTPEDILLRMEGNTAADGIYAVFKAVADYKGKTRAGNKNPEYWKYLDLLMHLFPLGSRYLFIVRDGRDVALSLRKVPWGGQSTYETALEWRKMVRAVDSFRKRIPANRLLTVRYEDLLQKPREGFAQIAQLVGMTDFSGIIDAFEQESSTNEKRENFDKWRSQMPKEEIEMFEALAGPELEAYRYERRFSRPRLSPRDRAISEMRRIVRLFKLNLYVLGQRLPQDKKEWQTSRLRQILRPGDQED